MDIFTVSLFGHRRIDNLQQLNNDLVPIIKELIQTKFYVSFLIGRNYVTRKKGGAYAALKYAQKRNKKIVNLGNP